MPVSFNRRRRGNDANVAELYPQPSGGSRRSTGSNPGQRVPAEDREPRATNCFQCGQPLEDHAQNDTCPFCGSDNVRGRRL